MCDLLSPVRQSQVSMGDSDVAPLSLTSPGSGQSALLPPQTCLRFSFPDLGWLPPAPAETGSAPQIGRLTARTRAPAGAQAADWHWPMAGRVPRDPVLRASWKGLTPPGARGGDNTLSNHKARAPPGPLRERALEHEDAAPPNSSALTCSFATSLLF